MLVVNDLHAYYGKSHILQGVNFDVKEGEIVSLIVTDDDTDIDGHIESVEFEGALAAELNNAGFILEGDFDAGRKGTGHGKLDTDAFKTNRWVAAR